MKRSFQLRVTFAVGLLCLKYPEADSMQTVFPTVSPGVTILNEKQTLQAEGFHL